MADPDHTKWMQRCLQLAHNGAGAVAPNPMVGAVLVQNTSWRNVVRAIDNLKHLAKSDRVHPREGFGCLRDPAVPPAALERGGQPQTCVDDERHPERHDRQ